jgi:hypothetical protein
VKTGATKPVALSARFIGALTIDVERHIALGATPAGQRAFAVIGGGRFEGPDISGVILPGGSDALVEGGDGAARPDVRLVVQTDDGATILIQYRGVRSIGEDGEDYWRCQLVFETGSQTYGWLNRSACISFGRMEGDAIVYDIFRIT